MVLFLIILVAYFVRNVRARPPVEAWLGVVETGMFDSVKR